MGGITKAMRAGLEGRLRLISKKRGYMADLYGQWAHQGSRLNSGEASQRGSAGRCSDHSGYLENRVQYPKEIHR